MPLDSGFVELFDLVIFIFFEIVDRRMKWTGNGGLLFVCLLFGFRVFF